MIAAILVAVSKAGAAFARSFENLENARPSVFANVEALYNRVRSQQSLGPMNRS
jgi:hypothetical protein